MKLGYIDHIDVLRALAVLLVVLFHLDFDFFQGGFIGVDVFFVISGFLITRLIKDEYERTNSFNFKNFYIRRARRLLPSLFLTLALTFVCGFLIFAPGDFIRMCKVILMSSLAASNFFFLGESGYFDISSNLKPLLHTWSLGIEEQFYLLWPLTLLLILKLKRNIRIITSIVLIFIISIGLTILTSYYGEPEFLTNLLTGNSEFYNDQNSFQFFLLPFRIFEFTMGAILVWIYPLKIISKIFKEGIQVLGFLLIFLSAFLFSKNTANLSTLNILPCLGIALLIINGKTGWTTYLFENKVLKVIGNLSYTWYLLHWPTIVFYKYVVNRQLQISEQVILFIVPLFISFLVYKYYETPLRHKLIIKRDTSFVYLTVIFILLFALFGNDVINNNGWIWRIPDRNIELAKNLKDPSQFHRDHYGGYGFTERGFIGTNNGDHTDFVLMGDSHAWQYSYGLVNTVNKIHGKSILVSSISSIVLPDVKRLDKVKFEDQQSTLDFALKYLKLNKNAVPIISHSWFTQMKFNGIRNDSLGKYEVLGNDEKGFDKLFQKIDKLQRIIGNRRMIIIGFVPQTHSKVPMQSALFKPKYLEGIFSVSSHYPQDSGSYITNGFFKEYAEKRENTYFLDPVEVFCKNGDCVQYENGKIYLSDGYHLSKEGSLKFAKYFENEILNILEL